MVFCSAWRTGAVCAEPSRGPDVILFVPAFTYEGIGLSKDVFRAPDYHRISRPHFLQPYHRKKAIVLSARRNEFMSGLTRFITRAE